MNRYFKVVSICFLVLFLTACGVFFGGKLTNVMNRDGPNLMDVQNSIYRVESKIMYTTASDGEEITENNISTIYKYGMALALTKNTLIIPAHVVTSDIIEIPTPIGMVILPVRTLDVNVYFSNGEELKKVKVDEELDIAVYSSLSTLVPLPFKFLKKPLKIGDFIYILNLQMDSSKTYSVKLISGIVSTARLSPEELVMAGKPLSFYSFMYMVSPIVGRGASGSAIFVSDGNSYLYAGMILMAAYVNQIPRGVAITAEKISEFVNDG